MVDVVDDLTVLVFTVKLPVDFPAATLTEVGTLAEASVDVSAITTEPVFVDGVAFNVTCPVEDAPPTTVLGERLRPVTTKGETVRTDV